MLINLTPGLSTGYKSPVLSFDCIAKFAVGRIMLQHIHSITEVNEGVIDDNNIYFACPESRLDSQAPNMATSIWSHLHHCISGI